MALLCFLVSLCMYMYVCMCICTYVYICMYVCLCGCTLYCMCVPSGREEWLSRLFRGNKQIINHVIIENTDKVESHDAIYVTRSAKT